MKKLILLSLILISGIALIAQAPQKMSFQSVVRNSTDELVTNSNIGVQISIIQHTILGTIVFSERHFPATNANGLVSLEIGTGTAVSGSFSSIDWSDGPYFIKSEIDLNGGANYTISGTNELLSVPYALYATTAGSVNENDPIFAASVAGAISVTDTASWNNKLDSFNETDPIYTASLASNITAKDTTSWGQDIDPNNEIQHLSQSGNNLFISGSRSVAFLPDSVIGYTAPTPSGFSTSTSLDLATVTFNLDKERTVLILADVNVWGAGTAGCEETIRLNVDGNPVSNSAVHIDIQAAVGGNNGDSAVTSWMTNLAAGSHTVKLRAWARSCPFHKHPHLHVLVLGN